MTEPWTWPSGLWRSQAGFKAQVLGDASLRGMTMGTTIFVWDPVFDCVTHELDENNNVKAEYHNEPQQFGGVLSQRRGTTSHYHHHDALGSTRFLTDSSGNVTDTYLNDAWGNQVASSGTTVNPFKWVGKYGYYTDNSTGQVYVRARMYQPMVARWASMDPLQFSDGSDMFCFVLNQPSQAWDRSGQLTVIDTPATFGRCGEYSWATEWELGANEQSGFIVQRVCLSGDRVACEGSEKCNPTVPALSNCMNSNQCDTPCYWELWPIHGGRSVVFGNRSAHEEMPSPADGVAAGDLKDTFAQGGCLNFQKSCSKGSHNKWGMALFIPTNDMGLPVIRKFLRYFAGGSAGVASACNLLSTCDTGLRVPFPSSSPSDPPPRKGNSTQALAIYDFLQWYFSSDKRPVVLKQLRVSWDCCGEPCSGSICTGDQGGTDKSAVILW